jgi:hypothetical protein
MAQQHGVNMGLKFYLSNLNGNNIEAQRRSLATYPDAASAAYFIDALKKNEMRGKYWDLLVDRKELLRATTRTGDTIVVTAPLAKDEQDFRDVLKAMKTRGDTLISLEEGQSFRPLRATDVLRRWMASKKKSGKDNFQRSGAVASANKKKAETERKAKLVSKAMWENPSYSNAELEEISGLSINALKDQHRDKWGTRRQAFKRFYRRHRGTVHAET